MITIVDYRMGNLSSIVNSLAHLGVGSKITSSPEEILKSERLILPGVGSFFVAMKNLEKMGIVEPLNEVVLRKKRPILGICLGMQLFASRGAENGGAQGLGWIEGCVERFVFDDPTFRIPHTGFNSVNFESQKSTLFFSLKEGTDFYFIHSYHFACERENDVSGWSDYHGKFVASVEKDNIYGTQFHPEKSQSNGLIVLRNFAKVEC